MKALNYFFWALLLFIQSPAGFTDEVRNSLFAEASLALKNANQTNASLLAPTNYSKASDYYTRADMRYQKGKGTEKVKEDLVKATAFFNSATAAARRASVRFETLLRARTDANRANANQYAPQLWQEATEKLDSAVRKLEADSTNSATKAAEKAEELFRQAELVAIKSNYLTETRTLIAKSKKEKIQKYAPKTIAKAQALLAKAETALSENRYDIDEPRSLAREAKYEVNHAFYIASRVIPLVEGDTAPEDLILAMEKPVEDIAGALEQVVELDGSQQDPTRKMIIAINDLRMRSYELDEKTQQLEGLEAEIKALESRMGIQNERLARQEKRKQQLNTLDDLFGENDATILTKGNDIIVRLVGLSFAPGRATIEAGDYPLLARLVQALELFPAAQIVVEGHTDSFGSDAANLNLSNARAEAVKTYLMANAAGIQPKIIKAEGFGESRPIGNNETATGRARNRRIDLLIKPE